LAFEIFTVRELCILTLFIVHRIFLSVPSTESPVYAILPRKLQFSQAAMKWFYSIYGIEF